MRNHLFALLFSFAASVGMSVGVSESQSLRARLRLTESWLRELANKNAVTLQTERGGAFCEVGISGLDRLVLWHGHALSFTQFHASSDGFLLGEDGNLYATRRMRILVTLTWWVRGSARIVSTRLEHAREEGFIIVEGMISYASPEWGASGDATASSTHIMSLYPGSALRVLTQLRDPEAGRWVNFVGGHVTIVEI